MGRSLWAGAILAALWLAGAAVASCWVAASGWSWRQGVLLSVLAITGAWAAGSWWRQPAGRMEWDGTAWRWHPVGGLPSHDGGAVRPLADLQALMLVEWSGAGRRAWLWLESRGDPHRWAALRRAVYSRADPTHVLTGTPPPSARP